MICGFGIQINIILRKHCDSRFYCDFKLLGSGSGGSSGSDFAALCKKDYAACQLKKHNELRKKHGSPAMTLNAQMNKKAEAWAQENANNHRLKHSADGDRNGNGENLWMGCGKDPAQATQDW